MTRREQVAIELKKYRGKFRYMEVSAKEGTNVKQLFMDIAQEISDNNINFKDRRLSF